MCVKRIALPLLRTITTSYADSFSIAQTSGGNEAIIYKQMLFYKTLKELFLTNIFTENIYITDGIFIQCLLPGFFYSTILLARLVYMSQFPSVCLSVCVFVSLSPYPLTGDSKIPTTQL